MFHKRGVESERECVHIHNLAGWTLGMDATLINSKRPTYMRRMLTNTRRAEMLIHGELDDARDEC